MKVWDFPSGRDVRTLRGDGRAVNEVEFNTAGDRVIVVGDDDVCRWWDWQADREDFRLGGRTAEIVSAAPTASSSTPTLLTIDSDGVIFARDQNGEVIERAFPTDQSDVRAMRLSADGGLLITIADRSVKVWNAATRELVTAVEDLEGGFTSASLSQGGARLAVAGHRGVPSVWEVARDQPVPVMPTTGTAPSAVDVALSSSGDLVAAVDVDGTLRVWNVQTGRPVLVAAGHQYNWLTFNAQQELLALGRDGERSRFSPIDLYTADLTQLIASGFTRLDDDGSLGLAVAAGLGGAVSLAITLVEDLDPGSREARKAAELDLLDKLASRTLTPADLVTYFDP